MSQPALAIFDYGELSEKSFISDPKVFRPYR